jgi:predicted GNAT family acetyltransferase
MTHVLDRPVWSALTTSHAGLAQGRHQAKRYPAPIVPFIASRDESAECLRALAALVGQDENLVMLQVPDIVLPPGLAQVSVAAGVQMLCTRALRGVVDDRIRQLTAADAREMLALAELTRPGPFSLQALSLGDFWGVKVDGRLVAMAGERMRQPGYTEVSGVCAHPDVRGQGLGKLLSSFVAARIHVRGEVPYLHAYATNTIAIALYESIGFELRANVNVAVVERAT